MMSYLRIVGCLVMVIMIGCKKSETPPDLQQPPVPAQTTTPIPVYGYEVVNIYPHDVNAFTEGLQYVDGVLYEGTGMEGNSSLRKVDLKSGKVLKEYKYPQDIFGEGITYLGGKIYQLTYRTQKGYVFDAKTFAKLDSFTYFGEGWGMTTDGTYLLFTNGTTNTIQYLDPKTLTVIKKLEVFDGNNPLLHINELELVHGELLANIWTTDRIVIIDPTSGKVKAYVDLSGLLPEKDHTMITDVLNGIAYDEKGDRLFVTGKYWSKIFEIKIKRDKIAS